LGPGAKLYIPDHFHIGSNVSIGGEFTCQTNATIGDDCLISSRVSLIGNDHDLYFGRSAYHSGRQPASEIELAGNNFIGYGATLIGSIRVGHGAIVGAGAVVTSDVPENAVVAGVPAKFIKYRYPT
jgi:acetyltransferase-like isoleucine patch superfamily enzyme